MKNLSIAIFLIAFSIIGAQAQEMKVDLGKLPPAVAAELLTAQQAITKRTETTVVPTVDQAKQWSDIGTNLATAVGATAHALSMEANDFVKTPVGWWAFAFIFWYFLGHGLWHIIGGLIVWVVLGSVIWRSFRIFHIPNRKVATISGTPTDHVKTFEYIKYKFESNDARAVSAIAHVAAFVGLGFIMLLIVFV
jgi:hypothetical protein